MGAQESINNFDDYNSTNNPNYSPSQKLTDSVSLRTKVLIAYDTTLYGKSQILSLMRDTRKIIEKNLIKKGKNDIEAKAEGKKFALEWTRKLYKIDSNDSQDHSEELYNIYIALKAKRIENQFETNRLNSQLKEKLLEDTGIKEYKRKIYVYDKGVIKRIPKIKEKVLSFDQEYRNKENKRLIEEKLEQKNIEFQKVLEIEINKINEINEKLFSKYGAEIYAYNCLKEYLEFHINSDKIKELETFFSRDKIKTGQFIGQYKKSPLYEIYSKLLFAESEIIQLIDELKK